MEFYSNNSTTKKIISGTLSMTLASFIVKLVGLAYKVPLSYILSDEGMGYFNSAYTVYSFFYLICVAGVPKAITILVSEAEARGEYREKRKIYTSSLKAFGVFGFLFSVALCLMAGELSAFIGNPLSEMAIAVIAPSVFFTAISGVMRGYLCAHMRFTHVAVSQMIDAILKTVLGIVFALVAVSRGYEIHIVSALTIFGATLGTLAGTLYLMFVTKIEKTQEKTGQRAILPDGSRVIFKVLHISLPITLSAAAMSLTNLIDLSLVMKRLVGLGYSTSQASALYGNYTTLVVPLIGVSVALLSPVAISVMPALATSFSRGDRKAFDWHLAFAMKIAAFVSVPIAFGLTFYSGEVLRLVFEDADATVAAPILSIGASAVVFMSLLAVVNSALESAGVVRAPIYSMLIGGGFKLIVSYYMIGSERFGISGAPIGTAVCYAVALTVSLCMLYRKIGFRLHVITVLLIPLLNSCLMILISKSIMAYMSKFISGNVYSALCIMICMILYFLLTLLSYIFYNKSNIFGENAQKFNIKLMKYDENV